MRVSVVINTYNRAAGLRKTLDALRYQTHSNFEVVVVNGPSTDDTEQTLREFADSIRIASCPVRNLSKSRNVGINAAAGDIVAFIDDDAIPEPAWLQQLVAGYESERVGGVGGLVCDHTGVRYQYKFSVADRVGDTRFDVEPPFDAYLVPGADPFLYLQGTNCSFRRECLARIGGFDEEIEYYLDEVEVCMQIIDSGFELRALNHAVVHHKYLASHIRNHQRVVFDPFSTVKNKFYFALCNGRRTRNTADVLTTLLRYGEAVRRGGEAQFNAKQFTEEQFNFFLRRIDEGIEVGIDRGLKSERCRRPISPAEPAAFRNYPTLRPKDFRLKLCFVSLEYPPDDFGGIGRFTNDLATGLAERGHEVHVITRSPDISRVDFEEGVWMHRLAPADRYLPELANVPLAGNFAHIANVYQAIARIQDHAAIDVVSAPLWLAEGLAAAYDPRFPTVLTLMTAMKTIAAMHPSWKDSDHTQQLVRLEGVMCRQASFLHAISQDILSKVQQDYGTVEGRSEYVVPLGIRDRANQFIRAAPENAERPVTVLFVGRLERRKGIDLLLNVAVALIEQGANVRFVLAGKDTSNTELGESYRAAFQTKYANVPAVASRVTFTGPVSEHQLYQLYADADVFCLPSRYESFGLVLVEAMMMGKPVVGTTAGGMREIVEVDDNGILAEAGDEKSLADCLGRLVGDPELRQRFGRRSRELYEQRFSLSTMVEETAVTYERIAHTHRQKLAQSREVLSRDPRAAVIQGLAAALVQTTGVAEEKALTAARTLLDPMSDYLAKLQSFWEASPQDFIRRLYLLLLGREPDADGLRSSTALLKDGESRVSRVLAIANSLEARERRLEIRWLPQLSSLAPEDFFRAIQALWNEGPRELAQGLYPLLLGRYPTGVELDTAADALREGQSRIRFIHSLAASPEARERGLALSWIPRLSTLSADEFAELMRSVLNGPEEALVPSLYRTLLGRDPDSGGLERFTAALKEQGRVNVLKAIADSKEARSLNLSRAWLARLANDPVSQRSSRVLGWNKREQLQFTLDRVFTYARRLRKVPHHVEELWGVFGGRWQEELTRGLMRLLAGLEEVRIRGRDLDKVAEEIRTEQRAVKQLLSAQVVPGSAQLRQEQADLKGLVARQARAEDELSEWIRVLQKKMEMMALDMRERVPPASVPDSDLEPRIADPASYEAKVSRANGQLRVNLGCGEKPLRQYINVDKRALSEVDVVADIRRLPFEKGSLAEIASFHLVEHFRQNHLATVILPYWRSLLKPGGILRTVCPNGLEILRRHNQGRLSFTDLALLFFGAQDYSGDDHLAMYAPITLQSVLERAGFEQVEIVTEDRQNGLCPEMELVARNPDRPNSEAKTGAT
jgi:glycogen synthase